MEYKYLGATAGVGKFDAANFYKMGSGFTQVSAKFETAASPAAASVFLLSNRSIPGRNCLVVGVGFSDLIDALTTSGGATVQVS